MSIFITFEGPDGSGKSTILNQVYDYLDKDQFIRTREPGGTPLSEKIRSLLLDKDQHMTARTEALLYAASRSQHVEERIRPALAQGKHVLCDRYILSSLAYQGYGRGLGEEDILAINDFATQGLEPDLILFFDIDPIAVLERKKGQEDRLELEADSFHQRVYEGYHRLLEENKTRDNFRVIDASRSIEEVFRECLKLIEEFIG